MAGIKAKLLALAVAPVVVVGTLAVEVALAINAPRLPTKAAYDLNRPGVTPQARRTLWLGDSTAEGVGVSSVDGTIPFQIAKALNDDSEIVARSVSGAEIADVLATQLSGLEGQQFDRIYISIGANDTTGRTSRGDFERLYNELLDQLPPSQQIVLLGVPDMGAVPRLAQPLRAIAGWRGEQLDEIVVKVARERQLTYVDIQAETGPQFRSAPMKYFASDDYHPNDAGYSLWRDAVVKAVKPL